MNKKAARALALICCACAAQSVSANELAMARPWRSAYQIDVAPNEIRACAKKIAKASKGSVALASSRLKEGASELSDAPQLAMLIAGDQPSEATREAAQEALAKLGPPTLGCVWAALNNASSEGYARLISAKITVETRAETDRDAASAARAQERERAAFNKPKGSVN